MVPTFYRRYVDRAYERQVYVRRELGRRLRAGTPICHDGAFERLHPDEVLAFIREGHYQFRADAGRGGRPRKVA